MMSLWTGEDSSFNVTGVLIKKKKKEPHGDRVPRDKCADRVAGNVDAKMSRKPTEESRKSSLEEFRETTASKPL